jgi:cytochrome c peroxidase
MKKIKIILPLIAAVTVVFYSCKKDNDDSGVEQDKTPYALDIGSFPVPDIAEDNPLTVQGVALGRMLFYEPLLSKDASMTCASCHRQEDAFTDTAKFSTGVRGMLGGRQAMAVFNMAWNTNEFFWDGRAHLLRDQSILPIQDELEMDETLENVVAKLSEKQSYKDQFMRTFGSEEINPLKISLALEQFMNSIVSNKSKYDKVLAGTEHFTPSERRGRDLFFLEYNQFDSTNSGADCAHCHGGFNFENDRYMNNGLDETFADDGRFKATEKPKDKGKFKVPSLRNIELTFPYMHDGRFATLEEVIEHYDNGIKMSSTLDPAIENTTNTGLRLSEQDKADLVAFLKTLTDYELRSNEEFSDPF